MYRLLIFLPATAGVVSGAVMAAAGDPTEGPGWVGTGLLGSVLAWLMFVHLPAKDKLLKECLAVKDEQITHILEHKWVALAALSSDHKETIKSLSAEFRTVVTETSAHCDREVARLMEWISRIEGRSVSQESPPVGKKSFP